MLPCRRRKQTIGKENLKPVIYVRLTLMIKVRHIFWHNEFGTAIIAGININTQESKFSEPF